MKNSIFYVILIIKKLKKCRYKIVYICKMEDYDEKCLLFLTIKPEHFLKSMENFEDKLELFVEIENTLTVSSGEKGFIPDNDFYEIIKSPLRITFLIKKKIFYENILNYYLKEYNAQEITMSILKENPTKLKFTYYDNNNFPKEISTTIKMKNIIIFY